MKSTKLGAVCCLILANVGLWASEKAKPCTKQEAIRADKEASSLRSWTELYKSYKKFAQCDDGGIGEGYSDSVARLLSDQWNSADELNRLVSHDKDFGKFVLRHIDELMSPTQAQNIRRNAEARCPSDGQAIVRENYCSDKGNRAVGSNGSFCEVEIGGPPARMGYPRTQLP